MALSALSGAEFEPRHCLADCVSVPGRGGFSPENEILDSLIRLGADKDIKEKLWEVKRMLEKMFRGKVRGVK